MKTKTTHEFYFWIDPHRETKELIIGRVSVDEDKNDVKPTIKIFKFNLESFGESGDQGVVESNVDED